MNITTIRVGTAALAIALAAAGCKSNAKSTSTSTGTQVTTPSSAAAAPSRSTPSSAATSAAGAKVCPAGYTSAVIGGVGKCLAAGQLCSSKHIGDYPTYGFTCELNGTRYTLKKKA